MAFYEQFLSNFPKHFGLFSCNILNIYIHFLLCSFSPIDESFMYYFVVRFCTTLVPFFMQLLSQFHDILCAVSELYLHNLSHHFGLFLSRFRVLLIVRLYVTHTVNYELGDREDSL